jgi:hypothetical protein
MLSDVPLSAQKIKFLCGGNMRLFLLLLRAPIRIFNVVFLKNKVLTNYI